MGKSSTKSADANSRGGAVRPAAVVRGPKRGLRRLTARVADLWGKALEMPALWIVLLLVIGSWSLTRGGVFRVSVVPQGGVASRDYVAPRDLLIPDEETTREKQTRAREEVPPVYDFDPGAADELERRIAALFATGRQVLVSGTEEAKPAAGRSKGASAADDTGASLAPEEAAAVLAEGSGLRISAAEATGLRTAGFAEDLEERTRTLAGRVLRRGIVEGKSRLLENRVRGVTLRNLSTGLEQRHYDLYDHLEYPVEVRDYLEAEVGDWRDLTAAQRRAVVELLMANLPSNLSPNRKETLERQEAAANATAPVFKQIRRGQVIVRKGDQIDPAASRVIAEITGKTRLAGQLLPVVGTFALVGLAAIALWLGLGIERVKQASAHGHRRLFCEVLLLVLLSLLGTKFCYSIADALAASFDAAPFDSMRSYVYGVPFAGLALVAALLFGRTVAALASFVFAVLVSRLAGVDALWMTIYAAIGSLGAVYAVDAYQIKQRLTLIRVGLLVGGLNVVAVLILTAMSAGTGVIEPLQLAFDLVCAFGGGLLVAAVGSFSVPILESTLGITTDIKLVELANANLPLLRRLAFEAPGTFQHSLMVANLSKEGCEAIGADPVLAYTGGLYHDVGKIFRPDYFVENQHPGHNRHDKLAPSMSVLIIISHVKDGLSLADEFHLPQPVRDAIAQHHGTRLINYFYERAKARAEKDEEVTAEKYRYPGPKPQTKVMGVLMLADGVEAASRTLTEPTALRIRTLVHKIVDNCLSDGQLDDSDLTLSDIKNVKRAFIRVLTTIFHHRIDYPGFDFKAEARNERRAERSAEVVPAS